MKTLAQTLDAESYDWLNVHHPEIVDAIETELAAGHTPDEIRQFVIRHTLRPELGQRCLQAARHAGRAGKE